MTAILVLAGALLLAAFWAALTRDGSPHGPGHGCNGCRARDERKQRAEWI